MGRRGNIGETGEKVRTSHTLHLLFFFMYNLNLKTVDFVLLQHRDILKNKLFR